MFSQASEGLHSKTSAYAVRLLYHSRRGLSWSTKIDGGGLPTFPPERLTFAAKYGILGRVLTNL